MKGQIKIHTINYGIEAEKQVTQFLLLTCFVLPFGKAAISEVAASCL